MSKVIENVKTTGEAWHNVYILAREALYNLRAVIYNLERMTEDGMPNSLHESVQGDRQWAKEELTKYRPLLEAAQKVVLGEGRSI